MMQSDETIAVAEPKTTKTPTLKQLEARVLKLEGKRDKLIEDLIAAHDEIKDVKATLDSARATAAKPSNGASAKSGD